jgi:ABC-type transporter Mla subunit MlaD
MNAFGVVMSGMWLQDVDTSGNSRLMVIFVGLVALAMLGQAVALIVIAVGASKAQKRGMEIAEELRLKLLPVIDSTQEILRDSTPKIKIITENLVETSHVVRSKAQDFDVTLTDVNDKTRAQVARVDGMVTAALTATAEIVATIQNGIRVPVREVSGLMNGLKAGLDVLVGRANGAGKFISGMKNRDRN